MSKKLNNLKWATVALEGFPASVTENLEGFVGLEECTDYGLDKDSKRPKKKKQQKQKRKSEDKENIETPCKKVKLSNGFVVENCNTITPSQTNNEQPTQESNERTKKKKNKRRKKKNKKKATDVENKVTEKPDTSVEKENNNKNNLNKKQNKPKLGEDITQVVSNLTAEDMLTWAEFKLPEPIMKALTELGFKKPTKIQQLTLPAAIHGRRDILGAAETGSGKTLAFGLPILSGILKLKEKADAKGLDVYDIPYKKSSMKRKNEAQQGNASAKSKSKVIAKNKKNKNNLENAKKVVDQKTKDSSEDGYSSGDDNDDDSEEDTTPNNNDSDEDSTQDNDSEEESTHNSDNDTADSTHNNDDEYLEEYEVPLRKRETSVDEGNNSDDSDNYIHLSDMLDSDDLADSSDDDEETKENGEDSGEIDQDDHEVEEDSEPDESGDEEEKEMGSDESGDESGQTGGVGCVKVVDNIDIPGHLVVKTGKPLYALILTPTRELAIQISRHLIAAAKYTGIRVATVVGGMAAVKQERVLRSGPEVVVATPGRLWELINQGQPHLQQLDTVKFLAIDETDRMVERGHFEELHPLLERLNCDEDKKSARQNFVFSATLTMVHELPSHMKGKKVTKRGKIINRKLEKMTPQQKVKRLIAMIGMTEPKVVDITTQNLGTAETLTECRIACAHDHKDAYLYYILKRHPGRTIVFCNSIGCVRRLAQLFTMLKCRPLPLHASMPQRQRLKNLERFRDDSHGVLIATDVAARGLDIPDIDHVVQYQVPRTAENYVHRSGRTARANKEGLAILMMEPNEAYLYAKLCKTLNKTSEVPTFPVALHSLTPIKELVSVARELDVLELKKKKAAQARGWREKVARDMDMIVDDDDVPVKQVDPAIDKALQVKKKQLNALLNKPLFPKGFSFKYPTLNDPMALSMPEENALQVMKKALETGELKKEKRKSKNAPLLKLQKTFKKKIVDKKK